jgi:hypothetical protein
MARLTSLLILFTLMPQVHADDPPRGPDAEARFKRAATVGNPAARGPDLSKINQSATRIFDRPGYVPSPFGYYPYYPYPPLYWPPPWYLEGPFAWPYTPVPPVSVPRFQPADLPPAAPPAPANARNAVPDRAKPPAPEKDELVQRAEMQRHLRSGNDAMAAGDYAAAAKRYEQAVSAAALEAAGYFHLAQAQIALGKFAAAGVSIQRGMRLHPKWPESGFQPRALYRDRGNDYDQHLGQLADAVAKNRNDDALLFLLGYQLWFDGQRDDARKLFERAAALAFDTTFVDRFLKAPRVAGP